jgi:hypothetical protein
VNAEYEEHDGYEVGYVILCDICAEKRRMDGILIDYMDDSPEPCEDCGVEG